MRPASIRAFGTSLPACHNLIRLAGHALRTPKTAVLGYDLSGRVEAVGRDVTRFEPGDEVFGTDRGSFAEYACARADRLAAKPANLSFEQAAAVPISGLTREGRSCSPEEKAAANGSEASTANSEHTCSRPS